MTETIKQKAFTWVWALAIVVVVSFVLFIKVIQPVLIDIHPMFATEPQITGRQPGTPDALVYFIMVIVFCLISVYFV
jgi:hypothetical protein